MEDSSESKQLGGEFKKIIADAIFKFSITSLSKYATRKTTDFAFSPVSIYQILYSMYIVSCDDFSNSLKQILYLPSECTEYESYDFDIYGRTFEDLNSDEENGSPSSISSNLSSLGYENYNTCFTKTSDDFVETLLSRIRLKNGIENFENLSEKIDFINNEIKMQTEKYISHPVKLSTEDDKINCILINFLKINRKFKIIKSNNYKQKCKHFYCDELGVLVSEYFYKNNNLSLFVLIPASFESDDKKEIRKDTTKADLSKLIERLETDDGIRRLRYLLDGDTDSQPVIKANNSFSPVFKIEKKLRIYELLKDLGLKNLWRNQIVLDKSCTENKMQMHVNNAMHRVRIEVGKKVTTGCAITVFCSGQEAPQNSKMVDTESTFPFVWLIYDKLHHHILFVGRFN